jgi:hypothetical protein
MTAEQKTLPEVARASTRRRLGLEYTIQRRSAKISYEPHPLDCTMASGFPVSVRRYRETRISDSAHGGAERRACRTPAVRSCHGNLRGRGRCLARTPSLRDEVNTAGGARTHGDHDRRDCRDASNRPGVAGAFSLDYRIGGGIRSVWPVALVATGVIPARRMHYADSKHLTPRSSHASPLVCLHCRIAEDYRLRNHRLNHLGCLRQRPRKPCSCRCGDLVAQPQRRPRRTACSAPARFKSSVFLKTADC